jgi:hypothetical protein
MDDRLEKAIEFSKFRVNLFNLKENIKIKVDSMLTYAVNGGIFKSSPELISFVKIILDSKKKSVVLIDTNGNPIEITNIKDFYENLLDRYFSATNFYYAEYLKLKKSRSMKEHFSDVFSEGDA